MDPGNTVVDLEAVESASTDSGIASFGSLSDGAESVSSCETTTIDSGIAESACSSRIQSASSSIFGSSESIQTVILDSECDQSVSAGSGKANSGARSDDAESVSSRKTSTTDSGIAESRCSTSTMSASSSIFGLGSNGDQSVSTDSGKVSFGAPSDDARSVSSRETATTDSGIGESICSSRTLSASSSIFGSSESLQTVILGSDCNDGSKEIDITVEHPNGTSLQMSVDPSTSVQEMKHRIGERYGYTEDQQDLYHKGKLLTCGRLRHDSVSQGSTLRLRLRESDVFVSDFQGHTHTIRVEPSCTVGTLKQRVASRTRVPERQQRLEYRGKILEQDNATLSQYKIPAHASLQMQGRLRGG